MSSPSRRQSVDLTTAQVCDSLALLPLTARSKSCFAPYSDPNFKHTPKWQEGRQYVAALSRLLQHSGGRCINQVTFAAGAQKYVSEAGLDLSASQVEEGCYRLRAILSQLANLKKKPDRSPPLKEKQHYDHLMAMIVIDPCEGDAQSWTRFLSLMT